MAEGQAKELERLTAGEWLAVRSRVAGEIKAAHSQLHDSTTVKIAEALLAAGTVDVGAVATRLIAEGVEAFRKAEKALGPIWVKDGTPLSPQEALAFADTPDGPTHTASDGASEQDTNEGEI